MTTPISNERILPAASERNAKTNRENTAPNDSTRVTEAVSEPAAAVDVSRTASLLAQEIEQVETSLQSPEEARGALQQILSAIRDNPQQALVAQTTSREQASAVLAG